MVRVYPSYLYSAIQVNCDNKRDNKNIILLISNDTIITKWQKLTFNHAQNWATHEVQPYTFYTSQQSTKIHHALVMVGPDALLTYFAML